MEENFVLVHRFARTFNREQLLAKIDRQNKNYGTVCTATELTASFCAVTGQLVGTDGNDDKVEGC